MKRATISLVTLICTVVIALPAAAEEMDDAGAGSADAGLEHDAGEPEPPPLAPENTLDACRDGHDNDRDGHVDCDDQDCLIFAICVAPAPEPAVEEADAGPREIVRRSFSVGFVPGLTTDSGSVGPVRNNFTVNFIGMGDYLGGAEISWLGGIRRYDVSGFQAAGLFNHTHGQVKGFQGAGIYNYAHLGLKGFQGAGIASVSGGPSTGFRAAGIATVAAGDVKGFSGAGIATVAAGDVKGFSGAGIANVSTGEVTGFQGAGISNYARGMRGAQISGIANVTAGEVRGFQAGLVNFGVKVKGAQVGLVNIATKEMKGAPIGLVNYAGDGIFAPVLWGSDTSLVNLGLKMGSKHVYGILGWGIHPVPGEQRDSVISGLGGHFDFDPGWVEIDLVTHWLHEGYRWHEGQVDMIHKLRVTVGVRPVEGFSLFVGPSLDLLVSEVREDVGLIPPLATYSDDDFTSQLSVGFLAGLQWEPRFGNMNSFKRDRKAREAAARE